MANEAKIIVSRADVMRTAWAFARRERDRQALAHHYREDRKPAREPRLPFSGKVRDYFAACLKEAWACEKTKAAEHAAFAALTVEKQIAIEEAKLAVWAAHGIDSMRVALPVIAAAQAHLNEVRAA